jgi:hypothetical protein
MNTLAKILASSSLIVMTMVSTVHSETAHKTASFTRKADPTVGWQSCTGTLSKDEDGELSLKEQDAEGIILKPESLIKGVGQKSLWCWAKISDFYYHDDPYLAPQVLRVCTLGQRCHIEGSFMGHGEFFWNKITKVSAD